MAAGQLLGTTIDFGGNNNPADDHLHFEIKARAVLHNPFCPTYIAECEDVETPRVCNREPPHCLWGYTFKPGQVIGLEGHPDDFGYYDPVLFLHNITNINETSVRVTQNEVNVRAGPETTSAGYPPLTEVNADREFTAFRKREEATVECSRGWYQIRNTDGSRIVATHFFDNDPDDEVPDGWVCADFVSEGN